MQKTHPGHKFSAKQRTADVLTEEEVDFESLLLSPSLVQGLTDSGFEKPSPIQLKAIPLGRCGLDLIAQAKSGTGKTCVFSVIALESINTDTAATQVLILAPTREIAVQIKDVVNAIGCHIQGLNCQVFIGGLPLDEDKKALKGCHVAVGSPGRIKYLIENGYLKTESVRMFILDEADKLLDDNFQEQINWIYSTLPSNKQMMAFSATYPEYLANHLTRYMREPTFVRLNASDPALQGIKQFYCVVPFHHLPHKVFQEKVEQLVKLLSKVNFHQCLLFSNYQIRAQSLSSTLCSKGWPATFIAGSQTQQKRLQAMEKLKEFKCRILISTDLTARGIDAENVNLVVNMDIPRDGETYLHRIGRAGRFGTKGVAVTFVAKGKEEKDLKELQKSIGISMDALPETIPESLMVSETPVADGQVLQKDTIEVNVLHKNHPSQNQFKSTVELGKSKTQESTIKDNMDAGTGKDIFSKRDTSDFKSELHTTSYHNEQEECCNGSMLLLNSQDALESTEHVSKGGVDTKLLETNGHPRQEKSSSNCILSSQFEDKSTTSFVKFMNKNTTENCTANADIPSISKIPESKNSDNEHFSNLYKNIHNEVEGVSVCSIGTLDQDNHILPSAEEFDKDFEEYLAFTNSFKTTFLDSNDLPESNQNMDIFNHQKINETSLSDAMSCNQNFSEGCKNESEEDDVQSSVGRALANVDDHSDGENAEGDAVDYYSNGSDHCVDDRGGSNNDGSLCGDDVQRDAQCDASLVSQMIQETLIIDDDDDPNNSSGEFDGSDDVDGDDTGSDDDDVDIDDTSSETSEETAEDGNEQDSIDSTGSEENIDAQDTTLNFDYNQASYGGKHKEWASDSHDVLHQQIQIDSLSTESKWENYPMHSHGVKDDSNILHNTCGPIKNSMGSVGREVSRTASLKYNSYKNNDELNENRSGFGSYRNSYQSHSNVSSTSYNNTAYQQDGHGHMVSDHFYSKVHDDLNFGHGSKMFDSHMNSNQDCCGNTLCPEEVQWRRAWCNSFNTINSAIINFAKNN